MSKPTETETEPLTVSFQVPEDCSRDEEFMAILRQALDRYKGMQPRYLQVVIRWFTDYADAVLNKH